MFIMIPVVSLALLIIPFMVLLAFGVGDKVLLLLWITASLFLGNHWLGKDSYFASKSPPSERLLRKYKEYNYASIDYDREYKCYLIDLDRYNKQNRDWWFELSGRKFEEEFSKVLKELGYSVQTTPTSGDGGIDIIATKSGKTTIIQCKAWKNPVGPAPMRELQGVREANQDAWMVGLGGFTKGAKEFASDKKIKTHRLL